MSKSVTVINGIVWTQRSVTWSGNVASGNVSGRTSEVNAAAAGDSPDDAPECEWDTIHEGRTFTRRTKRKQ
jgi:hypothetical protein